MGSQIENGKVQFWGMEREVQYPKPAELLAYPSRAGLDLLRFQASELPSHCYVTMHNKSSPSLTHHVLWKITVWINLPQQ